MTGSHHYATRLRWEGNLGQGTARYDAYARSHRVLVAGKPDLLGSADPVFLGDADRHNPEELFLASISACHMLVYLALCARRGIEVVGYEDEAHGTLHVHAAGGQFDEVTLHPVVTIEREDARAAALALHDVAHERCFVAASCRVPIRLAPTVRVAAAAPARAAGATTSPVPGARQAMVDLQVTLDDRPGALAELAEALGAAGVSLEGGGTVVTNGRGFAHYLVRDGAVARAALARAGLGGAVTREVVLLRLDQERPGQLGALTRRMAAAGVNIEAQYSDHDHQVVLVVDDPARARAVADAWTRERA